MVRRLRADSQHGEIEVRIPPRLIQAANLDRTVGISAEEDVRLRDLLPNQWITREDRQDA